MTETTMRKKVVPIKISAETSTLLRKIAALLNTSPSAIGDELVLKHGKEHLRMLMKQELKLK